MIIFEYSPLPDFASLDPYQKEICQFLKRKGEASNKQLIEEFKRTNTHATFHVMSKNTVRKHRDELIKKGIVYKTESGKYRIRKEVMLKQSWNPFMQVIQDGKMVDEEAKYFDLEELPLTLKNQLSQRPRMDRWKVG